MIETSSKVIGGLKYNVSLLGAKKGLRVLTKLLKIIGPAAASGSQEAMLKSLFENLDPDSVEFLVDSFAPNTTIEFSDGKAPVLSNVMELHFRGKYGDMLQWLLFCVQENFGSFLVENGLGTAPTESQTK